MNKIIKQLVKEGIDVNLTYDKGSDKIVYIIQGFYKSGSIKLVENVDYLIAHSRYGKQDVINNITDLVLLNFEWWQSSKNRSDVWINPERNWIPLMIENNLIKENKKVSITYTPI